MIAVFYDRKNKREVTSKQLMSTKFIQMIAVGDDDDDYKETGRRIQPDTHEPLFREEFEDFFHKGFYDEEDVSIKLEDWDSWEVEKTPVVLHLREELIADLAYKSEKCPDYCNWDLYLTLNDLVFLRLEDED